MLVFDFQKIGGKLLAVRKRLGMTQMEVAEAAGMSDRAYADIERGLVNMRVETILRICRALHISPDEVLTEDAPVLEQRQSELMERLEACSSREKETALSLLAVYYQSLS